MNARIAVALILSVVLAGCAGETKVRYVCNDSSTADSPEKCEESAGVPSEAAKVQVSSPNYGQIYVTLLKGGPNAPYSTNGQDMTTGNDAIIQMDAETCDSGATAGEFNNLPGGDVVWSAGETIVFDTDCTGTFAAPSATALASFSEHSISVAVRGNVVFTGTVTVR